ncbi:MAG: DM13 domain-containing protein [Saprospiraceae bacterium]|nr:DM13 domain-containing protein [Saprospiraceae bacterium]
MKKYTHFAVIALLMTLLFACKKEETVVTTPVSNSLTAIYQGSFTAASHPTTGTVTLSKDAAGKKYLVFTGFKTDAGPDLRVYLAEDLKATNFVEITNKVVDGTYQLDVAATIDTDKKRKVLIWCKQFSVLFGSADLK